MDDQTGLALNQCDREKPHMDISRGNNIDQGNNAIASSPNVSPVAEEAYTESSKCENLEVEQLLDLTVLDNDSPEERQIITNTGEEGNKELERRKFDHDVAVETNVLVNQNEAVKNDDHCEAGDQNISKESNELTKITSKIPETDSLISIVDDELETEMLLHEKYKPDEHDIGEGSSGKETKIDQFGAIAEEAHASIGNTTAAASNAIDKRVTVATSNGPVSKSEAKKLHPVKSRYLWVSNITRSIKATELKRFISKVGKVLTAKIVTDGKKCYGYVVMDNFQDAKQCLKVLNNTNFEGRKITVSFTKPVISNINKTKDFSKSTGQIKPKIDNETKSSKSKERKSSRDGSVKTRGASKIRSDSSNGRRRSRDSLTTKFDNKVSAYRPRKSRSRDRRSNFFREKLENDRLKRRLLDAERENRNIMIRETRREEKQRELEFKFERERRQLQFERELFETERRELLRLDIERRKIEKERLAVLQERTKLEEEMQKTRTKRKCDEFNLSSTIVKPSEISKTYDKRGDKMANTSYGKTDSKRARNIAKNSGSVTNRIGLKPQRDEFKLGKEYRERSKTSRREEDIKGYERFAPPPPSLSNEFDLSTARKIKHPDLHGDRKVDHGGCKIEVIGRKYYPDRTQGNSDRKNEPPFRKVDFDERRVSSIADKKYEYGRDAKRSRVEECPIREPSPRTQWVSTPDYTDPWKTALPSGAANTPIRYQDGNFSAPSYGGQNRLQPSYYHATPSTQDYSRYGHCSQPNARKY